MNNEELSKVIWKIPNWFDRIKIPLHIRDWGIYLVVRDVINIFEKFTDKGELIMKTIKWLLGLCLMAVVVCGSSGSVQAKENVTDNGIKYESYPDEDYVTITGYVGTDETVTIPSEIDGKPVKIIKYFSNHIVKHVIIQDGITDIERRAFNTCDNMESVVLPEGLTAINDGVFEDCWFLKSINIPSTVKTIGNYAFARCFDLINMTITLPDGLTSIGDFAFIGITSRSEILNIVMPDSVAYIGEETFTTIEKKYPFVIHANPGSYASSYAKEHDNARFICINHSNIVTDDAIMPQCTKNGMTEGRHCSDCGTVLQPQNVVNATGHFWDAGVITQEATTARTGIKKFTCSVCRETKTETIPKIETTPQTTIPQKGETVSYSNGTYMVTKSGIKNGTVEYKNTKVQKSNIAIPDTIAIDGNTYKVTSISKNAFKNNKKLKKVTIGKNITKINANAFHGCKNLNTITIKSKNLKSIGKNAFKGIKAKAKIKVPSSKLSKYKEMFVRKGQKSTVRIIK